MGETPMPLVSGYDSILNAQGILTFAPKVGGRVPAPAAGLSIHGRSNKGPARPPLPKNDQPRA